MCHRRGTTGPRMSGRATAAALNESKERFRTGWEANSEAMIAINPDGMVLVVNPADCTLYGCNPRRHRSGPDFDAASSCCSGTW